MTTGQIEITIGIHPQTGIKEVELVDRPDTLAHMDPQGLEQTIVHASAANLISGETLVQIGLESLAGQADTLREHCDKMDELREWLLVNRCNLTDEQYADWITTAEQAIYDRDFFDGEMIDAIEQLTSLRNSWTKAQPDTDWS